MLALHVQQEKPCPGISKCNRPRCLNCLFSKHGQFNYTFTSPKKKQHILDPLNCKSNYLFTLFNVKNAANNLHKHFGEHCCFILNYGHFPNPTPVSKHFNQTGHSINDVFLIPLKLICSNHDSVRRAHEGHLIDKAMT